MRLPCALGSSYSSESYPRDPLSRQTNPYPSHIFVNFDMSNLSGSSHFQVFFEPALLDYERQTGISLVNHPLAEQLQNCRSAESVTTVLHEQTRAFTEFRGSDKIMKSLKSVVSVLSKVSAIATLGHDISLVCLRIRIRRSTSLMPIL